MEKVCTGCKVLKSLDDFGNDKKAFDGKNQKCKNCCKERAKKTVHSEEAVKNKAAYKSEWQKKKRPILNARLRERYKTHLQESREQANERQKRFMKTERGIENRKRYVREWKENNIEKYHAHQKVKRALAKGILVKPKECEICHKEGKLNAHHEDYNKPLEVIWMCTYCHLYHHQREKFHAERLNERTSKEDAKVRTHNESMGGGSEEGCPLE